MRFMRSWPMPRESVCPTCSLLLKLQLSIVRHDFDAVAGLEFSEEEFGGEGVEDEVLEGAFEGAGAKLGVETFLGDELFGGAIYAEAELLLSAAFFQALELDLDDLTELFFVEAVEDNDVVHAIEEFGAEVGAQFVADQSLYLRVVFGAHFPRAEIFLDNGRADEYF